MKSRHAGWRGLLPAALTGLMLGASPGAIACEERLTLKGSTHLLPERWCGRAIDPALAPRARELVRLPDDLAFDDFRIYLRADAREALVTMSRAAAQQGIQLLIDSGYRSRTYQEGIIRRRLLAGRSIEEILQYVAPPGYSEHQTGRAIDLVPSDGSFAESPAYAWLTRHAAEYGFRESYPHRAEEAVAWEPWHWFFVPGADAP
jgi:D-alanyl-D-alanine carboxypeptidase